MMNARHRIKKMRHVPGTGGKRTVKRFNVSSCMSYGDHPVMFYEFLDQLDPAVYLRCKRRHVNALLQSRQSYKLPSWIGGVRLLPGGGRYLQPLTTTLKKLRPESPAHFLVRKNALVMHTDSLCDSLSGLNYHQFVYGVYCSTIILIRIRHQRRHPRRDAILREEHRDL